MTTTQAQLKWTHRFLVLAPLMLLLATSGCKPDSKPIITRMRVTPTCEVAPVNVECFAAVSGGNETGDALGGTNTLDVNWTFGDGATGNTSISFHTYDTAGDYTITVTASDQDGNTTARSMPISVRSDSLIVNAASNFPSGQATTTDIIQFGLTAESCDINYPTRLDDEAKMVFLWRMGDTAGTVFDGPAPAFTYTAAGTYDVSLTVTYPQLAISRHATMQMVITP